MPRISSGVVKPTVSGRLMVAPAGDGGGDRLVQEIPCGGVPGGEPDPVDVAPGQAHVPVDGFQHLLAAHAQPVFEVQRAAMRSGAGGGLAAAVTVRSDVSMSSS